MNTSISGMNDGADSVLKSAISKVKRHVLPLFVIMFIYGWNQYLWPLLIATDQSMYSMGIGIKRQISGGDAGIEWNLVMATVILTMLPPGLVVVLMQRWFIKGLVDSEK